jgi:methylthioribose-1-phosphate isomerase
MANAIKGMKIRGAPLLGAAAALALAQTAYKSHAKTNEQLFDELEKTASLIRSTRPTAVNLFNAIDTILNTVREHSGDVKEKERFLIKKALEFVDNDAEMNFTISENGARLINDGDVVLTHCNAGELATVEYGTALGIVKIAHKQGKKITVFATETRPLLQGARLTAFELVRENIPVTLITDSMVGYVMERRMVDLVMVGADRILQSGHVINKIGTYTIAVLAKENHIPFYVAAPTTTFDMKSSVEQVVIEERAQEEILKIFNKPIAPEGVRALNPAFDITPPELVTGLVTEKGVISATPDQIKKIAVD